MDIIFDDLNRVTATRFRFQMQVEKTQEDYIAGLLETRRATDEFATRLTANDYSTNGNFAQVELSLSDESYVNKQGYLHQLGKLIGYYPK